LFYSKNELEELSKFFLRIGQDILKPEEINWLFRLLSDVNPVLEPKIVAMGASPLEVFPVLKHWFLRQLVLERSRVALAVHEVEEGWVGINLITCADNSNV